MLSELGGEGLLDIAEGDELCGQDDAFINWAHGVYKVTVIFISQTPKKRKCNMFLLLQ
jgi:hypothetical protein